MSHTQPIAISPHHQTILANAVRTGFGFPEPRPITLPATPQYLRHRNASASRMSPTSSPWASAARSSEASLVARSHHSCVLSPCPHSAGGLWCRRSVPCCPASPGSSCRTGYLRPQDPGAFDGSVLPLPQFVLLRDPAGTDSDLRAVGSTVVGLAAVQLHCVQGLLRLVLYGVPDGP